MTMLRAASLLITGLFCCALMAQTSPPVSPSQPAPNVAPAAPAGDPTAPTAQNAAGQDPDTQKARALLQQMIQALGGDAWLNAPGYELIGRTSGFYQGKPTGAITDFWDYHAQPEKERIELGKKRQVYQIFVGHQGWEITYRGKRAIAADDLADYLRRRTHSVEAAARVWMKDPQALYIYGGQGTVERHLADKITILSSSNDNLTLELDADSHLPVRRSFEWRDPLYKDKNEEAEEYDDYHKLQGVATAFTVTRFHNGDMTNQRFLYNAVYGGEVPASMFDVDAAAAKLKK
jgi:hypothetical protein